MLKYPFYCFIATALSCLAFVPADDKGYIKVTMKDADTYEAVPFAGVQLRKDSCGFLRVVATSVTNMDGEAVFKEINDGTYSVWSTYVGYHGAAVKEIRIGDKKKFYIDLRLRAMQDTYCEDVTRYTPPPVIDPDTRAGHTVTREEYRDISNPEPVRTCMPPVYEAEEDRIPPPPVKVKPQKDQPSKKQKPRKAK